MQQSEIPELLTKREVALILRMSPNTLDTLCSRSPEQLPPFFKIGAAKNSVIRFRKQDVIDFINNCGQTDLMS